MRVDYQASSLHRFGASWFDEQNEARRQSNAAGRTEEQQRLYEEAMRRREEKAQQKSDSGSESSKTGSSSGSSDSDSWLPSEDNSSSTTRDSSLRTPPQSSQGASLNREKHSSGGDFFVYNEQGKKRSHVRGLQPGKTKYRIDGVITYDTKDEKKGFATRAIQNTVRELENQGIDTIELKVSDREAEVAGKALEELGYEKQSDGSYQKPKPAEPDTVSSTSDSDEASSSDDPIFKPIGGGKKFSFSGKAGKRYNLLSGTIGNIPVEVTALFKKGGMPYIDDFKHGDWKVKVKGAKRLLSPHRKPGNYLDDLRLTLGEHTLEVRKAGLGRYQPDPVLRLANGNQRTLEKNIPLTLPVGKTQATLLYTGDDVNVQFKDTLAVLQLKNKQGRQMALRIKNASLLKGLPLDGVLGITSRGKVQGSVEPGSKPVFPEGKRGSDFEVSA